VRWSLSGGIGKAAIRSHLSASVSSLSIASRTPASSPRRLLEAERSQILDRVLVNRTATGGHVETRSATEAVVIYDKPVNHVLHLLLCCVWSVGAGVVDRCRDRWPAEQQVSEIKAPIGPVESDSVDGGALWVVWMLVVLYACKQAFTGTTPTPTPTTSNHGERW
jgi:hypothetical protein